MKIIKILMSTVLLFTLIGCKTLDSDIPSKREVLSYVKKQVPTESYELINVEEDNDSTPKKATYTFKSKERDFTFEAISTLSTVTFDASETMFAQDVISCDYQWRINRLYYEDARNIITSSSLYDAQSERYNINSYQDIESAVNTVAKANKIYEKELKYNTKEYLNSNGVTSIHLVHYTNEDHTDWVNIGDLDVNCTDKEEMLDTISNKYAELYMDGKIEDDTIPNQYLEGKHASYLDTIYLNNVEMTYDHGLPDGNSLDDTFASNDSSRYKNITYDDGYRVNVDIGLLNGQGRSTQPFILYEYVMALGGQYKIIGDGHYAYKIGNDTFEVESNYGSHVNSYKVYKNNKQLDISYKTSSSADFIVTVSLDDFCKMLDLTYTVNEKEHAVYFNS